MPELPEVEYARRIAENLLVGKRVVEAYVDATDDIVFVDKNPTLLPKALVDRRLCAARRRGKYLWWEFEERPHLVLHFGMTGMFRTPGDEPLVLESSPKHLDRNWPPRFTKLRVVMEDGNELAMTNSRRLGRIFLRDDPQNEDPIGKLGFDPLLETLSVDEFRARLSKRKGVLKGVLLDQGFAAGVGNWIADEVLYQARIDPKRRIQTLDSSEIAAIHRALYHVIKTAVNVGARKAQFPSDWLFHRRWRSKQSKDEEVLTEDGARVEYAKVAGRTTAWVPSQQR